MHIYISIAVEASYLRCFPHTEILSRLWSHSLRLPLVPMSFRAGPSPRHLSLVTSGSTFPQLSVSSITRLCHRCWFAQHRVHVDLEDGERDALRWNVQLSRWFGARRFIFRFSSRLVVFKSLSQEGSKASNACHFLEATFGYDFPLK